MQQISYQYRTGPAGAIRYSFGQEQREMTVIKRFIKCSRDEKGITGLETAIILIAFVVVAAIFAYTVLSAGLFASQKSQEAVYSGLESTQGTMEVKGSLIGVAATTGTAGTMGQLTFTVALATGGGYIDFTGPTATGGNTGIAAAGSNNVVVIAYTDDHQHVEDLYWTMSRLGGGDADNMLEAGEKFQITIGGSPTAGAAGGNLVNALTTDLSINTSFTIQVKPPQGATLTLERTTPPFIDTVMDFN
jgi:archaeal flagellin FlaB